MLKSHGEGKWGAGHGNKDQKMPQKKFWGALTIELIEWKSF